MRLRESKGLPNEIAGHRTAKASVVRHVCSRGRTGMRLGDDMTTPDHAENTGDNLRHAAEVQQDAQENSTEVPEGEQQSEETSLPDFNT